MNIRAASLTRNLEQLVPRNVNVVGRIVYYEPSGQNDDELNQSLRLYFSDKYMTVVRLIVDIIPRMWAEIGVGGQEYFSFTAGSFINQQRLSIVGGNGHYQGRNATQRVAIGVCPLCRRELGVYTSLFVRNWGIEFDVNKIGCANYDIDGNTPLLDERNLSGRPCFSRPFYAFNGQMAAVIQEKQPKEATALLLEWANFVSGICRAEVVL